jgi:hypothetical protein
MSSTLALPEPFIPRSLDLKYFVFLATPKYEVRADVDFVVTASSEHAQEEKTFSTTCNISSTNIAFL